MSGVEKNTEKLLLLAMDFLGFLLLLDWELYIFQALFFFLFSVCVFLIGRKVQFTIVVCVNCKTAPCS